MPLRLRKRKSLFSKDGFSEDVLFFKCHSPQTAFAKGQSVTFLST